MLARLTQGARGFRLPASLSPIWRRPSWELWAYAAIIGVALGTRLWDVGGRSLHYDEIIRSLS